MATLAQLLVVTYGRGADDGVIHLARQYFEDISELDWVSLGADDVVPAGRRVATVVIASRVEGGIPTASLGAIYSWEFPELDRDTFVQELIASGWHKIAESSLPEALGARTDA